MVYKDFLANVNMISVKPGKKTQWIELSYVDSWLEYKKAINTLNYPFRFSSLKYREVLTLSGDQLNDDNDQMSQTGMEEVKTAKKGNWRKEKHFWSKFYYYF